MGELVFIRNNRPVTDSLTVAKSFDKEHRRVLQDIREVLSQVDPEWGMHHFVQTSYRNEQNGQHYPKYIMTEQGFTLLVMGYTGKRAMDFKVAYIKEFDRMKSTLEAKQQYHLPQSFSEALRMLADSEDEKQQMQAQIEANRPKVVFAESLEVSEDSILVADLAKLLRQNGFMVGEIRLFKWLRENGYLIKSGSEYNMPTQRSMEMGLFEVKVGTRQSSDGTPRMTRTPKVTGKGQIYFINKFQKASESA